ncbi:MAG: V-type ATP synthase subunit F [Gammaproteobacteria bacterium]|jgi:vacuolar-type H+-ATPase subunit F/Vma7
MDGPLFIGDELTATGFRLAGVAVRIAAPAVAETVLREVLADPPSVILLGADCAQAVTPAFLYRRQLAARPPILVMTGLAGDVRAADEVRRIRQDLGVAQ